MAKFKFEVQTEEYADYLKFACALDMVAMLHKVAADLDNLILKHEPTSAMQQDIAKISTRIDKFLNVVS